MLPFNSNNHDVPMIGPCTDFSIFTGKVSSKVYLFTGYPYLVTMHMATKEVLVLSRSYYMYFYFWARIHERY